ncbi:hypothetical protein MJO29_003298 [Puccinia striiformis f. sp. tritici]|nr:hypothetical protein MJO29_003298 [Puccinia striiformis f. sp. tritici]
MSQEQLRQRHQCKIEATPNLTEQIVYLTDSSSPTSSSSSSSDDEGVHETKIPVFELPQFTMNELLSVIPAHCFKISTIKSCLYLIRDLLMVSTLVFLASFIDPYLDTIRPNSSHPTLISLARFTAWALYGYACGLVEVGKTKTIKRVLSPQERRRSLISCTLPGIWYIAHDCGHRAFSASKTINDGVGFILHSALLVPYFSYRITHAQHHAAAGDLARDQMFVPKTRFELGLAPLNPNASRDEREGNMHPSFYDEMDDLLEDSPLWNLVTLVGQQLIGWPMYLVSNSSGQFRYPSWTNHFNPSAAMFEPKHRSQVLASGLGVGFMLAVLAFTAHQTSFLTVFKYYIVPYLLANHWIVMLTYVQHNDPILPNYRGGAHTFARGTLCAVDRKFYGFFFHGFAENHIAHHVCSRMPHYHYAEATAALKVKLGHHYNETDENCYKSLWKCYTQSRFVEDEGDVVFCKNAKGQAARRLLDPESKISGFESGVDSSDK